MTILTLRSFINLNPVLISALVPWMIAQILKVFLEYIKKKHWNWALLFRAGGMPSSHSAMVSGTALSIGLYAGFDSPVFAIAAVLAMIVIYDATGIRRESGRQAAVINTMFEEISKGKLIQQKRLREVLGHTPGEAMMGTLLGILAAFVIWGLS